MRMKILNLMNETRGFINNNPGNIRKGVHWKGEVKGADSEFEVFSSVEYGIRAIYRLLHTYYFRRKCKSIAAIINRYAPKTENPTDNYLRYVLDDMGKQNDYAYKLIQEHGADLDPFKHSLTDELVMSIIGFENGMNPFNIDFIAKCTRID